MKKLILNLLKILLCFCYLQSVSANVNVISWWGYFSQDVIKALGNKCNTTVSVDIYYSNAEFLRKMDKYKYSVAVFGNGSYDMIEKKIDSSSKHFNNVTNLYHKDVLKKFKKQKYYKNTAIFNMATSGFLYNADLMDINANLSIKTIFDNAKKNKITLIDDLFETLKLISNGKNVSDLELNESHFEQFLDLIKNKNVIITNDNIQHVKYQDFGFSLTWNGIAMKRILETPTSNLKFALHPEVSYIEYELVAPLSNHKNAICVAQAIASPSIIEIVINKNYYYSPFGISNDIKNKAIIDANAEFFMVLESLKFLTVKKNKNYANIINMWDKIKFFNNKKKEIE
ncbi:hypothetical protein [Spirobacillus cienkowskii]|uniref:hypothetical protein n=1 Tax=Spirobacillus cienkowskii TaxID=495820 RepID=UPI0030CA5F33